MSLKEETIKKLEDEINKYPNFSDGDKRIWKERIVLLLPEYAFFILDLFENSPEDILKLDKNIKEKEKIIKNKDKAAWAKLLQEEKEGLEKLI